LKLRKTSFDTVFIQNVEIREGDGGDGGVAKKMKFKTKKKSENPRKKLRIGTTPM
jgi:hypothetical protein